MLYTSPGNMHQGAMRTLIAAAGISLMTASPGIAGPERPRAVQLDLGLAVIGAAYEHPLSEHLALQVGGQLFSAYFAPWFDLGDEVEGFGGSIRPTYFVSPTRRGIYVAPFLRVSRVTGEHEAGASGDGIGFSTGVWAGYALGVTDKIDLRVGAGAQYMHYMVDTSDGEAGLSTPFIALDLVVGYRL